ncbi:hypothetical protein QA612_03675 [Evansella sp. AB-P1]|uniref:hypothetical protein n=1 Tax=Evansella sp. AB-P1 TaxID=3037653 RepID=UPI00241C6A0C|nr:hypothetical protein [Evansella sp. AB-P1]MDG5786578.1 hypothetical protein [Evansella sp. AB-P1]
MKTRQIVILGVLLLFLTACSNESSSATDNGEAIDLDKQEETSAAEVDEIIGEEVFFRNSTWGMSADEVKKTETAHFLTEQEDGALQYSDEFFDYNAVVIYSFVEGKLYSGFYVIQTTGEKEDKKALEEIKDKLTNLYGKPTGRPSGDSEHITYTFNNLSHTSIRIVYNSRNTLYVQYEKAETKQSKIVNEEKTDSGQGESVKEPTNEEEVQMEVASYAERHPELDPEIIEIFSLDEEYSTNVDEFFGEEFFSDMVREGTVNVDVGHVSYLFDFYDEEIDWYRLKTAVRVGISDTFTTSLGLEKKPLSFKILKDEDDKRRSLNAVADRHGVEEEDLSTFNPSWYQMLDHEFDRVFSSKDNVVGGNNYTLFKFIPLNDGYIFEIKLEVVSDFGAFVDEINYRMNNITFNPVLID